MTLDKLIEKLLEAKEHCILGNTEVYVGYSNPIGIDDVTYTSNNVYIEI